MALKDAEIVQALHIAHKRRPAPCVPLSFASLHYQTGRFVHLDLKLWKVTPRTLYGRRESTLEQVKEIPRRVKAPLAPMRLRRQRRRLDPLDVKVPSMGHSPKHMGGRRSVLFIPG